MAGRILIGMSRLSLSISVGIINVNHFGKASINCWSEPGGILTKNQLCRDKKCNLHLYYVPWQLAVFQAKEVLHFCSTQNNVGGVEVLTTLTADTRVCILGPVCG